MPIETLLALAGFAFASTWTPGPNNTMLAASGAIFGWRRTLPHAMGVALGFPVMLFLVALGLGAVFERNPGFRLALTWAGFAALLYLAWRIGRAGAAEGQTRARPLSFLEASAFQWINPKAWILAIGASATYASGAEPLREAAIAAAVFCLSGLTSSQGWTMFGMSVGRLLGRGWRLRAFNLAMAGLLVLSALWLVLDG